MWSSTRTLAVGASLAALAGCGGSAADADVPEPPALVVEAAGAELALDPVSWCAGEPDGLGVCADDAPRPPTRVLQVAGGEPLRVRLVDAAVRLPGDGCGAFCAGGQLELVPVACDDPAWGPVGAPVLRAAFTGTEAVLPANAVPGSYHLSAFVVWERPNGGTGDVAAVADVQIGSGAPRLVADAEAGCRTPQVPEPPQLVPGELEPACEVDLDRVTLAEQIAGADAVLVGTVELVGGNEPGAPTRRRVRIAVEQVLRGVLPATLDLHESACAGSVSDVVAGGRYVMFLEPGSAPGNSAWMIYGHRQGVYAVGERSGLATSATSGTIRVRELVAAIAKASGPSQP